MPSCTLTVDCFSTLSFGLPCGLVCSFWIDLVDLLSNHDRRLNHDPATASAGAPDTTGMAASDFEKIMAALNSLGSTMDTHGQVLALQQQTLAQHDYLLQQLNQRGVIAPLYSVALDPPDTGRQPYAADPPDTPQPVAPPPCAEPRLPAPQRYNGNPGACRGFLAQCHLTFELQPTSFPTATSRIAYIITF